LYTFSFFSLLPEVHLLERSDLRPISQAHGKESGYRGVSFVAMEKETLLRVCREKKVALSDVATALLEAMPSKFPAFLDEIRAHSNRGPKFDAD
jgi:hypothetical protein